MRRLLPFVAALVVAAPPTAYAVLSATKLTGTTGPGFTITVKKGGTKVRTLTAGRYTLTVSDRSSAHDFVLTGPGIRNRQITGLAFRGTKTVTVTLKKGRYEYYCRPHRSVGMRGFITVR
ncbi:MAG TPA: plastocyanin/azurin family copper-binding protein [Gaiellaceae bacterium]|jgi:plastocyanin|nr:plastocyanin/azurin family copper-binding protein [Gaiellaceae bacterium]